MATKNFKVTYEQLVRGKVKIRTTTVKAPNAFSAKLDFKKANISAIVTGAIQNVSVKEV